MKKCRVSAMDNVGVRRVEEARLHGLFSGRNNLLGTAPRSSTAGGRELRAGAVRDLGRERQIEMRTFEAGGKGGGDPRRRADGGGRHEPRAL